MPSKDKTAKINKITKGEKAERLAFVFPGQGSQYVGMGAEFAESFPEARRLFNLADEIMKKEISSLCFHGPQEALARTSNTQPAVFVVNCVCLSVLQKEGISPKMVAGHSLGEYSALVAAGALEFGEAFYLVAKRAELMQEAADKIPGKMLAALGLKTEKIVEIVDSISKNAVLNIANYNCPGQLVISGEVDAVDRAAELFRKAGAKRVIELKVGGGFHSSLMRSAEEKFVQYLNEVSLKDAHIPVFSNYTAKPSIDAFKLREALQKQITGSVLWEQSIRKMLKVGVDVFIEAGPGKILQGLIKKIESSVKVSNVEDVESLNRTLGILDDMSLVQAEIKG